MKKNQILVGLFLAGMTLGACTDDYTDWANPQSNPSEEAAAKYEINFAAGADATIMMDDVYAEYKDDAEGIQGDAVSIATLSSSNAMIESVSIGSVNVNGNAIAAELKNGQVMVNTLELDRITRDVFKSRAHDGTYVGCNNECRRKIDDRRGCCRLRCFASEIDSCFYS